MQYIYIFSLSFVVIATGAYRGSWVDEVLGLIAHVGNIHKFILVFFCGKYIHVYFLGHLCLSVYWMSGMHASKL